MYTLIHESVVAYFACRTSAKMPAASGALADVPVCISVQLLRRSVVTWQQRQNNISIRQSLQPIPYTI